MCVSLIVTSSYLETHFHPERSFSDWPEQFAIITAYATTGEVWTAEENESADRALADALRASGRWHERITGYSPSTGHAEPGWAVEMDLQEACDIGLRYLQDAIFFVTGDELCVSLCAEPRERMIVGSFRQRLQCNPEIAEMKAMVSCEISLIAEDMVSAREVAERDEVHNADAEKE
jgi:hypothetical protein